MSGREFVRDVSIWRLLFAKRNLRDTLRGGCLCLTAWGAYEISPLSPTGPTMLAQSSVAPVALAPKPQRPRLRTATILSPVVAETALPEKPGSDVIFAPPTRMASFEPREQAAPREQVVTAEPVSPSTQTAAVTPDPLIPVPPANPYRTAAPAAPVPPARVASGPYRGSARQKLAAAPAPTEDGRNFFEKLFDVPKAPPGPALAYANPEADIAGNGRGLDPSRPKIAPSELTAIYDIQAHVVYMPNGKRLEAHSGLGPKLDDPASISEKNRGVTPPNTYDLVLRESPFHGVRAIRLLPVDQSRMFGRTGILAHTYMLGPKGDSNGCVSFRDYPEFLAAFLRGEVKRLVVVTHATRTASLGSTVDGT